MRWPPKSRACPRPWCIPTDVDDALLAKLGQPLPRETLAFDLLRRPELAYGDLRGVAPPQDGAPDDGWRGDERLAKQVEQQVDVQAKYSGYLKRQNRRNRPPAAP